MNDREQVFVFATKSEMSDFMILRWKEISRESVERKGYFVAALSGGKTPVDFYMKLAGFKEPLPWNKTHIFLIDERFVPFNDEDSNYRMLRKTVLDHVTIPQENIHPISTSTPHPQISARKYEEELKAFFKRSHDPIPEFDLILLGIGEDGHTASLFPNSPALNDVMHLVAEVMLDERGHHRITLTLPVINHANNVIFLVSGQRKAAVVEKIINQKDSSLPTSMVRPTRGKLIFLIDREASLNLSLSNPPHIRNSKQD